MYVPPDTESIEFFILQAKSGADARSSHRSSQECDEFSRWKGQRTQEIRRSSGRRAAGLRTTIGVSKIDVISGPWVGVNGTRRAFAEGKINRSAWKLARHVDRDRLDRVCDENRAQKRANVYPLARGSQGRRWLTLSHRVFPVQAATRLTFDWLVEANATENGYKRVTVVAKPSCRSD